MVVLPIHSVVYLWTFVITIYGRPTYPFTSIFEEFSLQNMVVLPIHSVICLRNFVITNVVVLPICSVEYLRNVVITKCGSPTNAFGSLFVDFCH